MPIFVIRAGFEPTTHSLEGCCSIQLSYRTDPYFLLFYASAVFKSGCKDNVLLSIFKILVDIIAYCFRPAGFPS